MWGGKLRSLCILFILCRCPAPLYLDATKCFLTHLNRGDKERKKEERGRKQERKKDDVSSPQESPSSMLQLLQLHCQVKRASLSSCKSLLLCCYFSLLIYLHPSHQSSSTSVLTSSSSLFYAPTQQQDGSSSSLITGGSSPHLDIEGQPTISSRNQSLLNIPCPPSSLRPHQLVILYSTTTVFAETAEGLQWVSK